MKFFRVIIYFLLCHFAVVLHIEASDVSVSHRGIFIQCNNSIKEADGASGIFISEIKNFIMKNKKYIIGYFLLQLSFIMFFKLMLLYQDKFNKEHIDTIARHLFVIKLLIFMGSFILWFSIQMSFECKFSEKFYPLLRDRLCDLTQEGANIFENEVLKLIKEINNDIVEKENLICWAKCFLKFTKISFLIILLSAIENELYKNKKYLFFFACLIIKNVWVIAMLKNSSYYFSAVVLLYYILHKFSNVFDLINTCPKELATIDLYFEKLPGSLSNEDDNIDESEYSFEDGISAQEGKVVVNELEEHSSNYYNLFSLLIDKKDEEKFRVYEKFMNDRMNKFFICAVLSNQDSEKFEFYMICFFQCYCKMIMRHGKCTKNKHETCYNFLFVKTKEDEIIRMKKILSNFSYCTYAFTLMTVDKPDDKLYNCDTGKFNWEKINEIKQCNATFYKNKKSFKDITNIIKKKKYEYEKVNKFFKFNLLNL